jgi:hypothetical protein
MPSNGEVIYSAQGGALRSPTVGEFVPDVLAFGGHGYAVGFGGGFANDTILDFGTTRRIDELRIAPDDVLYALLDGVYRDQAGRGLSLMQGRGPFVLGFDDYAFSTGLQAVVAADGTETQLAVGFQGRVVAVRAVPGGFWVATVDALHEVAYDGSWTELAKYPAAPLNWTRRALPELSTAVLDGKGRLYQILGLPLSDQAVVTRHDPGATSYEVLYRTSEAEDEWSSHTEPERTRYPRWLQGLVSGSASAAPVLATP